jgi:hypothetical protein
MLLRVFGFLLGCFGISVMLGLCGCFFFFLVSRLFCFCIILCTSCMLRGTYTFFIKFLLLAYKKKSDDFFN